jgi:arginyl-tRNA synthetase
MRDLLEIWKREISLKIEEFYGEKVKSEEIVIDFPPKSELGDATTNVSFAVSKKTGKNPSEIAKALSSLELVNVLKIENKGPYLNFFLDRTKVLNYLYQFSKKDERRKEKIIVEHTNINPNKSAHIGHLRNAILGDTLVKSLRFLGYDVEVQNYIDDTGVQVADVVVAFEKMLGLNLEEVKEKEREREDFDIYCSEIYSKVQKWYEDDEKNLKHRYDTLHLIEKGGNETEQMAAFISQKMVVCHLRTMLNLNIKYNLLPFESDILKSGFFEECFEMMKAKGALEYVSEETQDKLKGCWVLRLSQNKEFEGLKDADKVFLRSNGTATYLAKDLSYQMWKFGLLKKDFYYRKFEECPYEIYRTSTNENDSKGNFGKGTKVYNVIDVRQSYLQKIVKEGLRVLDFEKEADSSIHFSYEMVALSTSFIKEEIEKGKIEKIDEEELKKPFLEMSGRKGLSFIANHLLNELFERAKIEIAQREKELEEDEKRDRAKKIASAALKYYILKFTKNQVVAFDLKSALSFEGETGPYIQYAGVRSMNILRKAEEKGIDIPEITEENVEKYFPDLDDESWQILSLLLRIPFIVERGINNLEMSIIARYLFEISKSFHNYYQKVPVIAEEDKEKRAAKLLFVSIFSKVFKSVLDELMGIEIPQRM